MAKIGLTGGFSLIPEGEYVFKITDAVYKEEYGKMEIKMETAEGQKHTERFSLMSKNGSTNDGALNAFSFFAKTALNDFSIEEIDHTDLIGCFMRCVVEHDILPSNHDPNKTVTFARLSDKSPADCFDEAVSAPTKKKTAATATKAGSIDLDKLLG